MNATAGALLRFWWLVVAGLAAGVLVAVLVYSLQSQAKHTATTQVFVNSPSKPYLRTQQTQTLAPKVRTVRAGKGGTRTVQQPPASTSDAPDTDTLVTAANLYPLLIASSQVKAIRQSQAGTIPGTVKATALNSSTNTFGVYRPSTLPVVEVTGTSRTAANATKLATATVTAFKTWLLEQQRDAGIPRAQRITVNQLEDPVLTTTGGPSWGLPLFVGALVFLGFCGLAVIADNARPRRASEPARTSDSVAPAPAASPHLDA
jgi:uncharacterized protein involved in exopolysaccharide biosynthesis